MAKIEQATLGGGCFWCLEAVYQQLHGVSQVVSGYAGGHMLLPDYRTVCNGTTGHAEVVQVSYDAEVISYRDLLDVFFTIHDPTTMNRQGADMGTQYRSAIYTHSDEQAEVAREVIAAISADGLWRNPIVTEVTPLERFWPAEDYHQNYWANNPNQGYCLVVIAPKVAKFRKQHMERLTAVR